MSPPRQLGRYDVIKKLGTGATASTYLATERLEHTGTTLLACLKVPHPSLLRDRQFREDFVGEAQIAATLHHPNIVQLEDVAHDEHGSPFLGFDFVEGMDLAELLAVGRELGGLLDWRLVALIAQEVARALEHAHEDYRGSGVADERPPVVHRDLAPSNILLGRSGGVYVTDFGLARALDRAWILGSGQRGRIAYTAPEYLMGQRYDARADLYSFGVVFFEALTGQRPFAATHMHQRNNHLERVLERDRPTIHGLRRELREGSPPPAGLVELARILEQLLEPDPDRRIQSSTALIDELSAIAIAPSVERELRETVRHHQPPSRRSIRVTTGEHPVDLDWSATDRRRVALALAGVHDGFDPERDGVRVSAEGAERLVAAFAHAVDESLDDASGAFAETDPDRESISREVTDLDPPTFDVTDPDRPAFDSWRVEPRDPPMLDAPALDPHAAGTADLAPIIPVTRPTQPAVTMAMAGSSAAPGANYPAGRFPLAIPRDAFASAISASASTHIGAWVESPRAAPAIATTPTATPDASIPETATRTPRFTDGHYALPVPDPGADHRPGRAMIPAALAVLIGMVSLCAISTASPLLVPLLTGRLGESIIDGFWTPLFTYGGLAGLALALALTAVAFARWRKEHESRSSLSRR